MVDFEDKGRRVALFNAVQEIIVENLGVAPDRVQPESHFRDDLGTDSLDDIELIMELEDRFDVSIQDEEAERFLTVGDVLTWLANHEARV